MKRLGNPDSRRTYQLTVESSASCREQIEVAAYNLRSAIALAEGEGYTVRNAIHAN